jgi:hypothetical protein
MERTGPVRPDDTVTQPTSTDSHDGTQGTDDTDADDTDDLDPDSAPRLVCGQTVPGPTPALLCPDCAAVADTTAPDATAAR